MFSLMSYSDFTAPSPGKRSQADEERAHAYRVGTMPGNGTHAHRALSYVGGVGIRVAWEESRRHHPPDVYEDGLQEPVAIEAQAIITQWAALSGASRGLTVEQRMRRICALRATDIWRKDTGSPSQAKAY